MSKTGKALVRALMGMALLALLCLAPFPAYLASLGAPHPAPST